MRKSIGVFLGICMGVCPAFAAPCNDPAVHDALVFLFVCGSDCVELLRVKTLAELRALSDAEIKQRVLDWRATRVPVARNENQKTFFETFEESQIDYFVYAKTAVTSVDAIAVAYDRDLKITTCEAKIQYDYASLTKMAVYHVLLSEVKKLGPMADVSVERDGGQFMINFAKNIVATALPSLFKTDGVLFTVQPKDPDVWNSELVVRGNARDVITDQGKQMIEGQGNQLPQGHFVDPRKALSPIMRCDESGCWDTGQ
jgi:hypothetical protein